MKNTTPKTPEHLNPTDKKKFRKYRAFNNKTGDNLLDALQNKSQKIKQQQQQQQIKDALKATKSKDTKRPRNTLHAPFKIKKPLQIIRTIQILLHMASIIFSHKIVKLLPNKYAKFKHAENIIVVLNMCGFAHSCSEYLKTYQMATIKKPPPPPAQRQNSKRINTLQSLKIKTGQK